MASVAFRALLSEPLLAFNRVLTTSTLARRLGKPRGDKQYVPERGGTLYVAASCLPYHASGYTTRTHEVIRALRNAGCTVYAHTRPGYPWDRKDRLCDAATPESVVEGISYTHARMPANNRPVLQYASQAAAVIAAAALRFRVAVIHAASNHVNALPALLAARRLGIPFHYEMRGLWELTRVSRQPDFAGGQAYRQGLELEALVARHADRLFVISQRLGQFVHENFGIAEDKCSLLPNCVDPDRFVMADPRRVEPDTIGYAGSLMGYEGLDTLIDAVAQLVRQGSQVSVNIIGDGEVRQQLEAQVQRLGLSDRVRFFGKMSPESARAALACCALVCIPRKPFKVCEIVPPIKMVEAMAMGKPLIVPDLPVFRDEMGRDPAGWFFRAGDAEDLARVISGALAQPAVLAELGRRARNYAVAERSWQRHVAPIVECRQGLA